MDFDDPDHDFWAPLWELMRRPLVWLGLLSEPLMVLEFPDYTRWVVESYGGSRSTEAIRTGYRRMEAEWKPGQPLPDGVLLRRVG